MRAKLVLPLLQSILWLRVEILIVFRVFFDILCSIVNVFENAFFCRILLRSLHIEYALFPCGNSENAFLLGILLKNSLNRDCIEANSLKNNNFGANSNFDLDYGRIFLFKSLKNWGKLRKKWRFCEFFCT